MKAEAEALDGNLVRPSLDLDYYVLAFWTSLSSLLESCDLIMDEIVANIDSFDGANPGSLANFLSYFGTSAGEASSFGVVSDVTA